MATKKILFLKNFFFKFNSSFLSNVLEDRLRTKKVFSQIFYFLRKQILFYFLSFGIFCFLLSRAPFVLGEFWESLASEQKFLDTFFKFGAGFLLFIGFAFLTKLLSSIILRHFDFLIARIQIAARFLMHPSQTFTYNKIQTSQFTNFLFSCLSIVPLVVLFYTLYLSLNKWFIAPLLLVSATCVLVAILKTQTDLLLKKTQECFQNDVKFFTSLETYLDRVRRLAFDSILQKKVISFSGESAPYYQKIFENEILITGVKYCSVFLLFCLNAGLFLLSQQNYSFTSFLPVLITSAFLSYYLVSFLSLFDYKFSAKSLLGFLKNLDVLIFEKNSLTQIDENDEDEQSVVSFKNASFVKDNQVIFHQMNHKIQKDYITTVVGSTPQERSQYLNACINSLTQVGGQIKTPKNFEFLSKNSIIFEGSIRENIVQLQEFDPNFYREVLKACALNKEIELLPDGDLTLINQEAKDYTASFVRKIAIARVVYAKSPVSFFDDPFVDLAPYDAAQIFCEGIQKILQGTSRIISTDKLEFAALSDEILVCKLGKIIEQGSHVALLSFDSLYSRLFYAGAENRRYEILQSHAKFDYIEPLSPLKPTHQSSNEPTEEGQLFVFGDQIFEGVKKKADKFSHFVKMFFPVFASRNFYAFFTFLTVSVWGALYSFYFVFSNISLNIVAKTSILFFAFSLIACVSFSVMLIFYKKVYATCVYIIENMSKLYFANLLTQTRTSAVDWKSEHILSVTAKFFKQLLNFFLIGFFCVGVVLLLSALSLKFITVGIIGVTLGILFIHAIVRNQFFFDFEKSIELNEKFKEITAHFFSAYEQTQSRAVRRHLLEKAHAKFYALYLADTAEFSKTSVFSSTFGFTQLWFNYRIIADMVLEVRTDHNEMKIKPMSYLWPTNGLIELENVKFVSDAETASTFSIPGYTRFLYTEESSFVKKSVFIEKLRAFSPLFSGSIKIDNENISQISSDIVLRRIGYISQTSFVPFLSIQEHVDPYGLCDDSEIWNILAKVGLAQQIALLKNGLETPVEKLPEEMHWSGEVVLLSFARCMINHNKVVCIDHIEVSEDVENQICHLITRDFAASTIIFATDNEKFKSLCNMYYPTLRSSQDVIPTFIEQDTTTETIW